MTSLQSKANHLIQYFGRMINTPLSLRKGICALYDSETQQEKVIIEVPETSESIILHCTLTKLDRDVSVQAMRKLLLLNFEISAMQGCWLAIDEDDSICLCHTLNIEKTDEKNFCDTLTGFIAQTQDVRLFIADLLKPSPKRRH